jgi:hypothetical protein
MKAEDKEKVLEDGIKGRMFCKGAEALKQEKIDLALHFIKLPEGRAEVFMEAETIQATKLSWGLNSCMQYPVSFIMLAVIKIPACG